MSAPDISTLAGLGGSGTPSEFLNLGFPTAPELPTQFTPIDFTGILNEIAPIQAPAEPFPGAPVVELPPLPGTPSGAPGAPPPVAVPVPPPTVEPMPPGAPGSPENPIQVTGTAPFPPVPSGPGPPGGVTQLPQPPVISTQTSAGGGAVAIATASINQNIQIMNQDVTPLATAVQQGIAQGAQDASKIAQDTTNQITASLNQFSNGLFGWVSSLWQWIKDNIGPIVQAVGNAVKDIAKSVLDAVVAGLKDIGKFFTDTIGPILSSIGKAVNNIALFYQQHIAPILNVISQVERTVAAAIVAIEKDVNSGLAGILRLPGDLANALSSIGNELIRAGLALRVHNAADADFYYVTGDGKGFAEHIKNLGDVISGKASTVEKVTYSPGALSLSEPTLAQQLPALIDAMTTILTDIAKGLGAIIGDPFKLVEALGIGGAATLLEVAEPQEAVRALWDIMKSPFDTVGELAAERVREIAQLSKLDPGTLAQAWLRGFVTKSDMDAELLTQGYNANRSEILRRLTTHVEDVPSVVDYLYRGIIGEDDFSASLRDLGFTDSQIAALREASTNLLDVQTALTAYRRGDLTEDQVNAVFDINRWNLAERELLKGLNFAPPNWQQAYQGYIQQQFLQRSAFVASTIDDVPGPIQKAGRADGLSDEAIVQQWMAGFNTLPASIWLEGYWRGIAPLDLLESSLRRDRVPQEYWSIWQDAQRPLIPFRTIPAMLTAGLISQSDAIAYLQKHGFSLDDAVLLMKYASRQSKSTKAATAASQKGISEAQAKTAYEDGLIGRDQYLALLQAHGWDTAAAALEIQLTDIALETKDRKQIGTDIVNEFQAGLIDQQTALQQLAQSGYTPAEQAAVLKKLRTASSSKAKTPSEAELRAFAKADIISPDDYQANLVTLGYSQAWAAAFRALHFPMPPPSAAAPA